MPSPPTTFVFPMAGESRRFFDAGYQTPKYQLPVDERTMFDHVLLGFERYFACAHFVFILRPDSGAAEFTASRAEALGIQSFDLVSLAGPTLGQADTVLLGLSQLDTPASHSITIFNIDTIRPNFSLPEDPEFMQADGFLETFPGEGNRWSFVVPKGDSPQVLATREKVRVSDHCSTGLYHFRHFGDFCQAIASQRALGEDAELYVAPIYNHLIAAGKTILWYPIEASEVLHVGTPSEYRQYRSQLATTPIKLPLQTTRKSGLRSRLPRAKAS